MTADSDKSLKQIERDLEENQKRADELEKEIEKAEGKHPPPQDHADDGGVI